MEDPLYGYNVHTDNTSTTSLASPVGQLNAAFTGAPNKGCTGTLIDTASRDRVLTAAHCVCANGAFASGITFSLPQAPGPRPAYEWVVHPLAYGDAGCGVGEPIRAHDLALITLAAPVAEDVVAIPAAVFLGNTHDIEDAVFDDGAFLVGFGGTVAYDSDQGTSDVRRWGYTGGHYPSKVEFVQDSCNKYDLFDGYCSEDNEWEVLIDPKNNAVSAKGDSGGPLLGSVAWQDLVIGVDSGWYGNFDFYHWNWDPTDVNNAPKSVYASTGSGVGGLAGDNAAWIIGQLGADLDGDEIPDTEDNCPPKLCAQRGLDPERCWNPDQLDDDNDGLGDSACDNCPPSVCAAQGKLAGNCSNPNQRNADNDAWGDVCDLCPGVTGYQGSAFPTQADGDNDGVGDECDDCTSCVGCADTKNGYVPCVGDGIGPGTCNATDGLAVVCIADSLSGASALGHCSRQLDDQDRDGFGGQCDTCGDIPTPSGEANSNLLAERRETAARLGDVCDPVPLAIMDEQKAVEVVEGLPIVQGNNDGPDDLVDLTGFTWLGRASLAQPAGNVSTNESALFRQCDCHRLDGSSIPDLDGCVGNHLRCDWTTPTSSNPTDGWRGMTLQQFLPSTATVAPLDMTTEWTYDVWKPTSTAANPFGLTWSWYADTQVPGRTIGHLKNPNLAWDARTNPVTTHGAVVAHVQSINGLPGAGGTAMDPNRENGHDLRDVFRMIDTPLYDKTDIASGMTKVDRFVCISPGCIAWLLPDIQTRPDSMSIMERVSAPTMMLADSSRVLAVRGPRETLDVTSRLSTRLAQFISASGTTRWMTPSEPGYRIRQNGAPLLAAVMTADLDEGEVPQFVLVRGSGLTLNLDEVVDPGLASMSEPGTQSTDSRRPPALKSIRGVFSGVERAVYLVGGPESDSPARRDIWRFDMRTSSWSRPAEAAVVRPSSQVLDVAYDSVRSVLYVLDVDDQPMAPGNHAPHLARLVAYDLHAGTATQLAAWPRVGLFSRVFLATEADGHLMLVAARSNNFTAWRLAVVGDHLRVDGVRARPGLVMDRPVMGERDLVLGMVRQGRIEYEVLGTNGFAGGSPCTQL